MKSRFTILKHLIILGSTIATTAVLGQTTYVWTNATGTDIGVAANWSPNGQPSGASEDAAEWDGVVAGNLSLVYATGWPSTGFGTSGVNLVMTSNQTGSVTIVAPAAGSPAAGINGITNNSPAGSFIIGDSTTTTNLMNLATRPGVTGQDHPFVNNSSSPNYLNSSIAWVAGGGDACTMDFSGTGNWVVNHNLRQNNSGAGPITVIWEGPGTMTWSNGGTFLSSDAIGPISILSGTVILNGAGLCASFTPFSDGTGGPGVNNVIVNSGTLDYNFSGSDIISRDISSNGAVEVSQGTLTLSGPSTYYGNTVLNGGTLILGSAETGTTGPIGESNTIEFNGGTLEFSVNNTSDYSSRFSTAAGQQFNINGGAQSIAFATGLSNSSSSLSFSSGTLTLTGTNAYSGATTVNSGILIFQGPMNGTGNITVADSATLGVTATSTQVAPGTLILGSSGGAILDFFNVNSTSTAIIAANTFASAGTQAINIESGTFTVGDHYPLLSWTSGSAPAVTLLSLNGYGGTLSTNGNTIQLNITEPGFTWSGANNGNWDLGTPNNWLQGSTSEIFANGAPALFNDSLTGTTSVVLDNGAVDPTSVTFNNTLSNYSLTSSSGNDIADSTGLTKEGTNTLTMSGGANTYTGVTSFLGGIVSVGTLANGGSPSDIGAASSNAANLLFNGGTLQYTGNPLSLNRSFTLGTAGGAIDSSGSPAGTDGLVLNGSIAFSGSGNRVFTLTGTDTDTNILAGVLSDNTITGGTTALVKNGAGDWYLTGNNAFSGGTTIEAGTLQVGVGGTAGSLSSGNVVDDAALIFDLSNSLTVGNVTGTGSVTLNGTGAVVLPGANSYQGGTTINSGTLQIGNGGAGSLDAAANITDDGALVFDSTSTLVISGVISGTGTVKQEGSGLVTFIGANTYTGTTTVNAGTTLQLAQGNTGACASTNIIDNGEILSERQDNGVFIIDGYISGTGKFVENVSNGNAGDTTLDGTNTYTGGTYILGGGIVLGDDATPGAGAIVGNVFLTNNIPQATFGPYVESTITFNRPDNFTFPGNIVGQGNLVQEGSGTMTVTGNLTYTNGTTLTAGTLQIGAGGTSGFIGGAIVNNSALVFDLSGTLTSTNVISGGGNVVQLGSGTLTLNSLNTYTGSTTVSNGTLEVTNVDGDMDVNGGTLASGPLGSFATMGVGGNMNIAAGTIVASLDTTLPMETNYVVSGSINSTGGTVELLNFGPKLVAGDQFYIFNQAVTGSNMTIISPGFTVTNNLGVNGSVTVTTVASSPVQLGAAISGGQLHLSWAASYTGLVLQVQTNSLGTNWVTIAGTGSADSYSIAVTTNKAVYYRLAP